MERIGEGGMADVYKAHDPDVNRFVALKILRDEYCSEEEYRKRFLREGRAAGALIHPNIVSIFGVGSVDGAPYIAMELLTGTTLDSAIRGEPKIQWVELLEISRQLASALGHAHAKGIIHRDLKPENIILDAQSKTAKITDFGVARISDVKDKTQVGFILGTPRYMSPEQALGSDIDARSDLFSLGVLLYEAATCRRAFEGGSLATLIRQILEEEPTPIGKLSPEVPKGLQKIIAKLLQKKPERRFQSAAELEAALSQELQSTREAEEQNPRYMPLHLRWSIIMTAVILIAVLASSTLAVQSQRKALTAPIIDSGASLGKVIAAELWRPILQGSWVELDAFVSATAARDTFRYLTIADHEGIIRSASDATLVGTQLEAQPRDLVLQQRGDLSVAMLPTATGEVFDFRVDVIFDSDTIVGEVAFGVDAEGFRNSLATTKSTILLVALAVGLAVFAVFYSFNRLMVKQIKHATEALRAFAAGRTVTRISIERSDEFGDLFTAYNLMADEAERLIDGSAAGRVDSYAEGDEQSRNEAAPAKHHENTATDPVEVAETVEPAPAAASSQRDALQPSEFDDAIPATEDEVDVAKTRLFVPKKKD
ncbi:MAG: protein kinase [Pseudomonadota bacterium]